MRRRHSLPIKPYRKVDWSPCESCPAKEQCPATRWNLPREMYLDLPEVLNLSEEDRSPALSEVFDCLSCCRRVLSWGKKSCPAPQDCPRFARQETTDCGGCLSRHQDLIADHPLGRVQRLALMSRIASMSPVVAGLMAPKEEEVRVYTGEEIKELYLDSQENYTDEQGDLAKVFYAIAGELLNHPHASIFWGKLKDEQHEQILSVIAEHCLGVAWAGGPPEALAQNLFLVLAQSRPLRDAFRTMSPGYRKLLKRGWAKEVRLLEDQCPEAVEQTD